MSTHPERNPTYKLRQKFAKIKNGMYVVGDVILLKNVGVFLLRKVYRILHKKVNIQFGSYGTNMGL